MAARIRITSRMHAKTYGENQKAPFWLEHLLAIILVGLVVVVGGFILLSLTDWGRATLVWLGLASGVVLTIVMLRDPVRSRRAGEPRAVWVGETMSALGWGCQTTLLAAGLPLFFWVRPDDSLQVWGFAVIGAGVMLCVGLVMWGLKLQTSGPLPALDRTPRTGTITMVTDDADGGETIAVRYRGADGERHDAELADLIDDSWLDRFSPGSTWQVYAFRDARLFDAVVFLTEAHDDVWRDGYKLDGVRMGGEGGPLKPGPGSPFLGEGGKWQFEG